MRNASSHPRFAKPFRPVLVAAALAAVVALAALATPAGAAPRVFPICVQMGGQAGPDIDGAVVLWTDHRNGDFDIYGRNLSTDKGIKVCVSRRTQDNPAVTRTTNSGSVNYLAVWADRRNNPNANGLRADIYGKNLTTGREFIVAGKAATAPGKIRWYPDISDKWVVWLESEKGAGPYTLRARDLSTGTSYTLNTTNVLSPPAITRRTMPGGGVVHTVVYTAGDGDIAAYDLPSLTHFVIADTDKYEWNPDISGNRVVWWEGDGKVMLKNIATGRLTFVAHGSRPRIDGNMVAWDGGGKGGEFTLSYTPGAAVYVRNVSRATKTVKIAQPNLTCLFPVVSSHWMVWESGPAERILGHIHLYGARVN